MKQVILVTGAAGFIGRVVVAELLKAGYSVVAMVRPGSLAPFDPHPQLSLLWADITDYKSFAAKVRTVDVIIHLAANKYHPTLSYEINIQGARNVVRLIEEQKLRGKRLINISSQSTKIRWRGVYGESKRQSDVIIESSVADWTTLKPSLVYGEGKDTLFQTIRTYVETLPVVPVIGNGQWELYPIDVTDLAQAIIKTIEKPASIHRVYDLGAAEPITFDQLVRLIQSQIGIKKPIFHIPALLGLLVVYVATKVIKRLPISVDNVLGSTQNTDCDPSHAIRELKLKLTSIEAGIEKYLGRRKDYVKRIAVVGLGKMGILHASLLSVMPEVEVSAIVDTDTTLGNTALSMGINARFYQSLHEAVKKEKLDAVYICTPTFAHKEVITVCQKHGLAYFVEKPVFPSYRDFVDIAIRQRDMAGYFWIYKREVEYVKNLLTRRVLGTILSYTIALKHSEVFGPKKGWMFVKHLSGGGVLANPGPHALSLALFLFGKAKVAKAKMHYLYGGEVEDRATVALAHQSGIRGVVSANWSVKNHPVMSIDFVIKGSSGIVIFKNQVLTVQLGTKKQVLQYDDIPIDPGVFDLNPRGGGDAYYKESSAFISSLKAGTPFVNTLTFASQVEKILSEAYEKAD